ncbi:hypothetical protein QQF64_019107 [Cirrhinus molitorella]|uniref:Uncharacterized protein n=1 Tax=Cirrhinus molitorella TaxID=172907 RepID=A0ABR3LGX6_9TELE
MEVSRGITSPVAASSSPSCVSPLQTSDAPRSSSDARLRTAEISSCSIAPESYFLTTPPPPKLYFLHPLEKNRKRLFVYHSGTLSLQAWHVAARWS